MINVLTTIFGFIIITASVVSVFMLPKVNWGDSMWAVLGGVMLIYVKNNAATQLITKIFEKYDPNKQTHIVQRGDSQSYSEEEGVG